MSYSMKQIIDVIINFYHSYAYTKEAFEESSYALGFIEDGYCVFQENDICVLTEKGQLFVHGKIMELTETLYGEIDKINFECEYKKIVNKFVRIYSCNAEDAEEVIDFLIDNSNNHGYEAWSAHSTSGKKAHMKRIK